MLFSKIYFDGEVTSACLPRAEAGVQHGVPQQQDSGRRGERPEEPRILLHARQQHERGERTGERERKNVHRHPHISK
jgi:hypothetical protein